MSILDNIKLVLAHATNRGGKRNTKNIKYIVIHYTGVDGDYDTNNVKYFQRTPNIQASAHYFVGSESITQSVPDDMIAWHCGGKKYKHKSCRNANSIGIEICDEVKDGRMYPKQQTINNALMLTEHLMKKYNIPKSNVIRHYDVTGKLCPAYWVDDTKWMSEFWLKLKIGGTESYLVKVTADVLNVRKEPTTASAIVTKVKKNEVYTIVEEHGTWGKLKSGVGWISLNYTKRI